MKRKLFFSVLTLLFLFVLVSCASFSKEKSDATVPLARQNFSVVCSGKILFDDSFGTRNEENTIEINILRGMRYPVFSPFVSFDEGRFIKENYKAIVKIDNKMEKIKLNTTKYYEKSKKVYFLKKIKVFDKRYIFNSAFYPFSNGDKSVFLLCKIYEKNETYKVFCLDNKFSYQIENNNKILAYIFDDNYEIYDDFQEKSIKEVVATICAITGYIKINEKMFF